MNERELTPGEWQGLSAGLTAALRSSGARPRLRAAVHPAARIAGLLRRTRPPILARGDVVWWPATPPDLSSPGREGGMAILQHELQHVLDYRIGWLTAARYLAHPRHWTYDRRLELGVRWDDLGAEQRASMAEAIWLMENGRLASENLAALRALVPWA